MGGNVNGRDDEATGEVAAHTQHGVLNVFCGADKSLEIATVFHVSIARLRDVVGAHRFRVENGLSHARVRVKALEGVNVDVVHNGVVRVSEVHGAVGDLGAGRITALHIQSER